MTTQPDIKLPILTSKYTRRRNLTSAGKGSALGLPGMIDNDLLWERFMRASQAEDATRHLRVPLKIKLTD